MIRDLTYCSSENSPFDHPIISAMDARRQFAISIILISTFVILSCVIWLI